MIEPYMTLYYVVKDSDISFFYYAMREMYFISEALSALKPKYACKVMKQVHISDIKAADSIFQETCLANF